MNTNNNLALFFIPPSPEQSEAIALAVEMDRLRLNCKKVGCGDDTLAIHETVVCEIAIAQTWFPNSTVQKAGLELLCQNLSMGAQPYPNQADAKEWAIALWNVITSDNLTGYAAAAFQPEIFALWIQTAQKAWQKSLGTV